MARFSNTPVKQRPARSNPTSLGGSVKTYGAGSTSYVPKDAHVELFNLAVSGFLADKFYETGSSQIARIRALVPQCDPAWLQNFIPWLRAEGGMRSASVVIAAEYVRAGFEGGRSVVASALQRPDEPGEFLGYWKGHVSYKVPSKVKRGISDAMKRLYHEKSLLKYDGSGNGWRFGDVIEVTHPTPKDDTQSALFKFALDRRRHGNDEVPGELEIVQSTLALEALPQDKRLAAFKTMKELPAGFTWERLSGWLPGGMTAEAWEKAIPNMGAMALVRNLNNFDKAGISKEARAEVIRRISDPEEIERSGMFPYRFLTAYKNAETHNYKAALSDGADIAIGNLPAFKGAALIMVDQSGSMCSAVGEGKSRNPLVLSELAGFMAEVIARRFTYARIVPYGTSPGREIKVAKHLPAIQAAAQNHYGSSLGGTNTWGSTKQSYKGEDIVIILTDEQHNSGSNDNGTIKVPVVTWNLAGYRGHHADHGTGNRLLVSGVSDQAIQVLPSVIARSQGFWPWER